MRFKPETRVVGGGGGLGGEGADIGGELEEASVRGGSESIGFLYDAPNLPDTSPLHTP